MRTSLAIATLMISSFAFADQPPARTNTTDFTCVNNCTQRGYMYNYCVAQCSDKPPANSPSGTDYQCLNDCTRQGYLYNVCKAKCSY